MLPLGLSMRRKLQQPNAHEGEVGRQAVVVRDPRGGYDRHHIGLAQLDLVKPLRPHIILSPPVVEGEAGGLGGVVRGDETARVARRIEVDEVHGLRVQAAEDIEVVAYEQGVVVVVDTVGHL